jgi:hypothetical protein
MGECLVCFYTHAFDVCAELTRFSGGVRGIVQLTILEILEERIDLGMPIQQFFDLIVGTRYVLCILKIYCDPCTSGPVPILISTVY